MSDNVITLFKKPGPIEIELPLTDEEIEQILTEIKESPKNEMVEFHFVLISENKCLTISAHVNPPYE